jgi:hypothetical protein
MGIDCGWQDTPDQCSVDGCGWSATFELAIGEDWPSGAYRATLTAEEILLQRPELAPFAPTVEGMLRNDPMVRTDDDVRFTID